MITEKDLQEAIAECEGQRNPNANTCIKLAAFYTIRQHMFGGDQISEAHSFASQPSIQEDVIQYAGDSEFAEAILGLNANTVWLIMDELMQSLSVLNPRLYAGVMRKIEEGS